MSVVIHDNLFLQVVPRTAGTNGNISVTVYGQDLGSKLDDVNNISLAGVPCILQRQKYLPSKRSVKCSNSRK